MILLLATLPLALQQIIPLIDYLFLGIRQRRVGEHKPPMWMLILVSISLVVSLYVAKTTLGKILPKKETAAAAVIEHHFENLPSTGRG